MGFHVLLQERIEKLPTKCRLKVTKYSISDMLGTKLVEIIALSLVELLSEFREVLHNEEQERKESCWDTDKG